MRFIIVFTLLCMGAHALADTPPRARDLGVPFDGTPGPHNAITDVPGVEVGHSTIIRGDGKLVRGEGPVRTGVTALIPRGRSNMDAVFAAVFAQNGFGEMTGVIQVEETGQLWGPILITNTHSVGVVRDASIEWGIRQTDLVNPVDTDDWWGLQMVAETWDGWLNDINGFHVRPEHTFQALDSARAGPVTEGNVGGGTGMIAYEFKAGIGSASRVVEFAGTNYTLGVLVQANFGERHQLMVAGVPVGKEITEQKAYDSPDWTNPDRDTGSVIVIVATDAPLLPHQLKRIAKRVAIGAARTGGIASSGSGDIFVAFSTGQDIPAQTESLVALNMLPRGAINLVFNATVEATEEAIINALVAAETMTGVDGHKAIRLPHDRLREVLKKYNRLSD